MDARNSYAVNAEIPEGPPEPIDDGFGLGGGGMPAQDSAAQATTLAQMTAEQQIGEEGRLAGMLRRLRGLGGGDGGGLLGRFRGGGGGGGGPGGGGGVEPAAGVSAAPPLSRQAGWVWPLARI